MILIDAVPNGRTQIGRLGENDHRGIRFPSAATLAMYPDATVTVLHQRPGDPAAYPVDPENIQIQDGRVIWEIKSSDLTAEGTGTAELIYTQGTVVAKTEYYRTQILPALDGSGTPPEPWESWQESLVRTVQGAYDAAEDARGWANGTDKNGNPVPSTDTHYENNAKYWSEQAEGAVEHYPRVGSNGNWEVWDAQNEQWTDTEVPATGPAGQDGTDGQDGQDGQDGVSPAVTIESITGGHRITIVDADGTHTADVMDGEDGQDGQDGTDGEDGTDGVSPTVSISDITGGHRVTITDATGDHSFDVMDGTTPTVPVTDVQVNGSSVINNGVASIPIASSSVFGVAKTDYTQGVSVDSNGKLAISYAADNEVKAGTSGSRKPITPSNQHVSAFYGLAKVAGDSTQSGSSNAVGTYTDAAKVAIQKMLGIYEAPWELIREDTVTNATATNIEITVDGNGQPFELTDAILQFETPVQDSDATLGSSGGIYFYYSNSFSGQYDNFKVEIGGYTQSANSGSHGGIGAVMQSGNLLEVYRVGNTTNTNTAAIGMRYGTGFEHISFTNKIGFEVVSEPVVINKIAVGTLVGTGHYILYGKRKWTA